MIFFRQALRRLLPFIELKQHTPAVLPVGRKLLIVHTEEQIALAGSTVVKKDKRTKKQSNGRQENCHRSYSLYLDGKSTRVLLTSN